MAAFGRRETSGGLDIWRKLDEHRAADTYAVSGYDMTTEMRRCS